MYMVCMFRLFAEENPQNGRIANVVRFLREIIAELEPLLCKSALYLLPSSDLMIH